MKEDLGEKVYKENFPVKIRRRNDRNGHLNNSYYPIYAEYIRQEFLKSFDWKDKNFGGEKISMLMGELNFRYRNSLKKGDKIKIKLEIFFRRNPFFHMVYTFYTPLEDKAAIGKTLVSFANSETERTINIPDFFLKKMRNC